MANHFHGYTPRIIGGQRSGALCAQQSGPNRAGVVCGRERSPGVREHPVLAVRPQALPERLQLRPQMLQGPVEGALLRIAHLDFAFIHLMI